MALRLYPSHMVSILLLAVRCLAVNPQGGCYSGPGPAMLIHDQFRWQAVTHCIEVCMNKGFNYAAIHGIDCYCGAVGPPSNYEIQGLDVKSGWKKMPFLSKVLLDYNLQGGAVSHLTSPDRVVSQQSLKKKKRRPRRGICNSST
jgi:hypothetical protein